MQPEQWIPKDWMVIVNPVSGRGETAKGWPEMARMLREAGVHFETVMTSGRNHAVKLAAEAIHQGWRGLIAVGGDGTVNEVVNGIFRQKTVPTTDIVLGMIPMGTGNDWGRTIGIPSTPAEAIQDIAAGRIFTQDVGLVRYDDAGLMQERYYVNIAGLGYDATVVAEANQRKEAGRGGGKMAYLTGLFSCLLRYKAFKAIITTQETTIETDLFSLSAGICKYSGGGMMLVPGAIPDDGFLDLTIIHNLAKMEVLKNVGKLFNGSFITHPRVQTVRTMKVSITSEIPVSIEADGELLGTTPVEIVVLPGSLRVITHGGEQIMSAK